jgi:putative transposase
MSMARETSPASGRAYGVVRVCRAWRLARSTYYSWLAVNASPKGPAVKRGPKTRLSDDELFDHIVEILSGVEGGLGFSGEGYRKVWARLRHVGVHVAADRVLRLMREEGRLAPQRAGRPRGPKVHDGSITQELPNQMWGTDL